MHKIPDGLYCYTLEDIGQSYPARKYCTHYQRFEMNSKCLLTADEDNELINDACKTCGINVGSRKYT